MTTKKEFWELTGLDTTKEDFENNGFTVINFGMVKKALLPILGNAETAKRYNLWNKITDPKNKEMQSLNDKLSKIVFKESRCGGGYSAIGWENGVSYLRYHSEVLHNWFK